MAIDPSQIELTPEQKERLAHLAEHTGKDCTQLVDDLLAGAALLSFALPAGPTQNSSQAGERESRTAYDAFAAVGAIGCIEHAPSDLSTNPKHMEGFGTNASRKNAD